MEKDDPFRQRLEAIIEEYNRIATRKNTTHDASLAHDLGLLRDEVQAHVMQRHRRQGQRVWD